MPGIMAFLQNPPPITDQRPEFATSVVSDDACRASTSRRSMSGRRKLTQKMRALPGFVDVNSDLADRQPAGDGGHRPRSRSVARCHAAAGSGRAATAPTASARSPYIYAPANQYAVILEVLPAIPAHAGGALQALSALGKRCARAAGIRGAYASPSSARSPSTTSANSRGDRVLQPAPGYLAG